jgi:hypothetical protein
MSFNYINSFFKKFYGTIFHIKQKLFFLSQTRFIITAEKVNKKFRKNVSGVSRPHLIFSCLFLTDH